MNTELAKAMARVIGDKWNQKARELDSKEVYEELRIREIEVPEGDMHEILESFKKAGIITGPGYMNSAGNRQHGAMVITSVDLALLNQLDFD
jgi:hypothetical protein